MTDDVPFFGSQDDNNLVLESEQSTRKESDVELVKEAVEDRFTTPDSEGFSLDFVSKYRTGDQIRKNFLSKLTYQKIWLTP